LRAPRLQRRLTAVARASVLGRPAVAAVLAALDHALDGVVPAVSGGIVG
jgi:hypothetical protein